MRKCAVILLINIFVLAIVSAQPLSPEGQALRDLLSGPNCQHVCFDGLEPAVTTLDEVKNYFAERGINYTVYEGIGNLPEKDSIHYWKPVGVPFIDPAETISSDIGYANGIVMRLEVSIKIPISAVLEVYGNPVDVQYDDGGRYYLIYPDLGLTFQANAPDLDNTVAVLISTPDLIKEVFLNPPLHPSLQECPEPIQLCNISTATPISPEDAATLPASNPDIFSFTELALSGDGKVVVVTGRQIPDTSHEDGWAYPVDFYDTAAGILLHSITDIWPSATGISLNSDGTLLAYIQYRKRQRKCD